jgi:hypothetical protein
MKAARIVIILVAGVALLAGALVFLSTKRKSKIDELQKQAETAMEYRRADVWFKGTDADKTYIDGLFNSAKDTAKSKLGALLSVSPPPDEKKYYTAVYQSMIDQAKEQGKSDLAKSFQKWAQGRGFEDVKF